MYRAGMAAFDGNAPSYHIELREHPTEKEHLKKGARIKPHEKEAF